MTEERRKKRITFGDDDYQPQGRIIDIDDPKYQPQPRVLNIDDSNAIARSNNYGKVSYLPVDEERDIVRRAKARMRRDELERVPISHLLIWMFSFGLIKTERHKLADAIHAERTDKFIKGLFGIVSKHLQAAIQDILQRAEDNGIPFTEQIKLDKERTRLRVEILKDIDNCVRKRADTYGAVINYRSQTIKNVENSAMSYEDKQEFSNFIRQCCDDYTRDYLHAKKQKDFRDLTGR